MRKIFIIFLINLFLFGCSPSPAEVQEAIDLTETAKPKSTTTITPSITAAQTKSATETQTATIKNTATVTKTDKPLYTATDNVPAVTNTTEIDSNIMSGVTPAYLQVLLEEKNFNCEIVYAPISTDPYYKWECRKEYFSKSILLEIWSLSIINISTIRTRIIQYGTWDDSVAINYLGFIATIPYDGSNPQQARNWVENTLPTLTGDGDVREVTIGDIKFRLYGNDQNISLKIGED